MTTQSLAPPATIGFVGLGNMGYPMAKRLASAGYTLVVADLNNEAVESFCAETGSTEAENLQQLGSQSDVVITMLPEGKAVRTVLMDPNGVVSNLKPGAILIDMSSCSPVDTRVLSAELRERGFDMIDAPVSGGVVKAVSGGLAIMAGGVDDAIAACRPLLEVMGKVFATGSSGTGHAMKAMNNFLSAATLAITSEALITGTKFGLDPAVMVDIINASTGRSNSSEHKFPTFILPRKFTSGFFLGLMAKDLRFAKALNDAMHTPGELLTAVSTMWDKAEAELGFHADNTEIHKYLEQLSDDNT
ncbi:MAG: NAD(P)-dependent oxidoreductase [Pseudomonadota bacterium]